MSSIVLEAAGWAHVIDERAARELDKSIVTREVAAAIESDGSCASCDTIIAGMTLMLGTTGRAAAERDSNRIREAGKSPVLMILISGLTAVITTVGADLPRVH